MIAVHWIFRVAQYGDSEDVYSFFQVSGDVQMILKPDTFFAFTCSDFYQIIVDVQLISCVS